MGLDWLSEISEVSRGCLAEISARGWIFAVLGAMGKGAIVEGKPKALPIKKAPKAKAKALPIKDKPKKAVEKKPAAGPSLLRRMNAMSEEDDNENAGSSGTRDKGKAVKYNKMRSSGSLPKWAEDLIENQSLKASSPRQEKTALINKLFRRKSDGSLELALDSPVFVQAEKVPWFMFGLSAVFVRDHINDHHITTFGESGKRPMGVIIFFFRLKDLWKLQSM